MTDTTTTPPPARGGACACTCRVCGCTFPSHHHRNTICSDRCRAKRNDLSRKAYRERLAQGIVSDRGKIPPQPVAPRVVPVKRAATLADTPDIPAVTAARGDYLTGGAAATMQAPSGGRSLGL